MNEFIEKLIGRLEEEMAGHLNLYCDGLIKAMSVAKELAEEYNDGWISCENKLPKEAGCYLVSSNAMVFVAYWFNNTWWGIEKRCRWKNIVAWQPLQAPYKPKGE